MSVRYRLFVWKKKRQILKFNLEKTIFWSKHLSINSATVYEIIEDFSLIETTSSGKRAKLRFNPLFIVIGVRAIALW